MLLTLATLALTAAAEPCEADAALVADLSAALTRQEPGDSEAEAAPPKLETICGTASPWPYRRG